MITEIKPDKLVEIIEVGRVYNKIRFIKWFDIRMWWFSRYWNRLAYFFIHIGRAMIWDQTGRNGYLLKNDHFANRDTESIMCNRQVKVDV